MKNISIFFIALFLCVSCATISHNDFIRVEDDPFKTEKIFRGISKQDSDWNGLRKELSHTSYIKSYQDKRTGEFTHELYAVITYYGDFHFFERAAFRGGKEAEFISLDQTREYCTDISCKLTERFAIPLDKEFLTENIDGFDVKAFSQSGKEVILTVTNLQISGQLNYLGID